MPCEWIEYDNANDDEYDDDDNNNNNLKEKRRWASKREGESDINMHSNGASAKKYRRPFDLLLQFD